MEGSKGPGSESPKMRRAALWRPFRLKYWMLSGFDFPALFVVAAPEFHGVVVVENVAGFGVEVEFAAGEVSDVGELQDGDADVGDGDGGVEFFAGAYGVDEVKEVGVGHGVAAYGVGGRSLFAGFELVDELAVPVVVLVAVAVDEDGAFGSEDGGAALTVVDLHTLAAAAFPVDHLVAAVGELGVEGVVELPVVFEVVAAASGGDLVGIFDAEGPAADVDLVGAVVEGLAGAVATEPVPVVGLDVVDILVAWGGALPEIPVEGGWNGGGFAGAHGEALVHIPGLGVVRLADEAVVDLLDDLDGVVGGALLIADLDQLAVFLLGFDKELALAWIVAGGLFYVDVLSGLKAVDSHGGVPVVGHGDGDDVDVLGGEDLVVVAFGGGGVAELLGGGGDVLCEDVGLDVADVGDAGAFGVVLECREVGVAAAVEADDREVEAVVGAGDLGVAFCCGGEGRSGEREGGAIDEFTARDHCFSLRCCT
jgi:hypothetical protein